MTAAGEIRRAVAALRPFTDPRGHDVLDALESTALHLAAYTPDDPKSDGYHGRMADVYDLREKTR